MTNLNISTTTSDFNERILDEQVFQFCDATFPSKIKLRQISKDNIEYNIFNCPVKKIDFDDFVNCDFNDSYSFTKIFELKVKQISDGRAIRISQLKMNKILYGINSKNSDNDVNINYSSFVDDFLKVKNDFNDSKTKYEDANKNAMQIIESSYTNLIEKSNQYENIQNYKTSLYTKNEQIDLKIKEARQIQKKSLEKLRESYYLKMCEFENNSKKITESAKNIRAKNDEKIMLFNSAIEEDSKYVENLEKCLLEKYNLFASLNDLDDNTFDFSVISKKVS